METKHTKESIRELLTTNDRAVLRALIVLTARQTESERSSKTTTDHNGRGWNGRDAAFGTSLAEQVEKRGSLSPKQIVFARRMVMKYAGQLAEEANAKSQAKAATETAATV